MSWLDELKEGDQVVVRSRVYGVNDNIHEVERASRTRITVSGRRFRRVDGQQCGDSHNFRLAEATTELVGRVLRNRSLHALTRMGRDQWEVLDDDEVAEVMKIVALAIARLNKPKTDTPTEREP